MNIEQPIRQTTTPDYLKPKGTCPAPDSLPPEGTPVTWNWYDQLLPSGKTELEAMAEMLDLQLKPRRELGGGIEVWRGSVLLTSSSHFGCFMFLRGCIESLREVRESFP